MIADIHSRREIAFEKLVGKSEAFKSVLRAVETVAPSECSVLICGENGIGKEMIGRAIHSLSSCLVRNAIRLNLN